MMKLNLQMFGTGSLGAHGGGGGGGRSVDKRDVKKEESMEQMAKGLYPQRKPSSGMPEPTKTSTKSTTTSASSTYVSGVRRDETYTVYTYRNGKADYYDTLSGNDITKALHYDAERDVWKDSKGNRYKIKVAKRK